MTKVSFTYQASDGGLSNTATVTINLAPAVVTPYVALGQMYLKAGRLGRAGRMAREALRWEPGHEEASELLVAAGDEPDERTDMQKGLFGSN